MGRAGVACPCGWGERAGERAASPLWPAGLWRVRLRGWLRRSALRLACLPAGEVVSLRGGGVCGGESAGRYSTRVAEGLQPSERGTPKKRVPIGTPLYPRGFLTLGHAGGDTLRPAPTGRRSALRVACLPAGASLVHHWVRRLYTLIYVCVRARVRGVSPCGRGCVAFCVPCPASARGHLRRGFLPETHFFSLPCALFRQKTCTVRFSCVTCTRIAIGKDNNSII